MAELPVLYGIRMYAKLLGHLLLVVAFVDSFPPQVVLDGPQFVLIRGGRRPVGAERPVIKKQRTGEPTPESRNRNRTGGRELLLGLKRSGFA